MFVLAVVAGCSGAATPDGYVLRDPCAALAVTTTDASASQVDGVASALVAWRTRGVPAFDLADPVATVEIRFEAAAPAFHGYYDAETGIVYVNRGLDDRDQLAIVIAHELGHAFGLEHVDLGERRSVMNPGNLVTPPSDQDRRALEQVWGGCE